MFGLAFRSRIEELKSRNECVGNRDEDHLSLLDR